MAWLTEGDLVRAHGLLGASADLIAQRRAVYRVPFEFAPVDRAMARDHDLLDHPISRGHLADVLGGAARLDPAALRSLSDGEVPLPIAGRRVVVAASATAASVLRPALDRIAGQLPGPAPGSMEPLTRDDPGFGAALGLVRRGLELAIGWVPALSLDLLPHLSLVALLHRRGVGRLGSASAREFPGLMVAPVPESDIEFAEAFVHECAHLRFFDLMITRSIFNARQYSAPAFRPSWADTTRPPWPLEQAYAAFHAYCCLAVLADTVAANTVRDDALVIPAASLLPEASTRAAEIGGWLTAHTEFLGANGRRLLAGLSGGPPPEPDDIDLPAVIAEPGGPGLVRRVGDRTLVAQPGRPYLLYWARNPPLNTSG